MATSGSNNFIQNRNAIILDAFQLLGIYGIGRTVSPEDMTFAVNTLNRMIKTWSSSGLHLWCKQEGVLYVTQYQGTYSLGNASTDAKVTAVEDEIITQLDGALAASATSVTVDSTTEMTVGDYIGIVMTSGNAHWTTIASIPTSTTLTLTSGVSAAAGDRALVFAFTNKAYKPLRIHSARCVTGIDSGVTSTKTEIQMAIVSYMSYFDIPVKGSNGRPVQLHYNPDITSGDLYLWPRPDSSNYRIEFTYERILQDLDEATDDFDFPAEWLEPLMYQLAIRLAPAFGRDQKATAVIGPMAVALLHDLKDWDSEITGLTFVPDFGGN